MVTKEYLISLAITLSIIMPVAILLSTIIGYIECNYNLNITNNYIGLFFIYCLQIFIFWLVCIGVNHSLGIRKINKNTKKPLKEAIYYPKHLVKWLFFDNIENDIEEALKSRINSFSKYGLYKGFLDERFFTYIKTYSSGFSIFNGIYGNKYIKDRINFFIMPCLEKHEITDAYIAYSAKENLILFYRLEELLPEVRNLFN